MDKPKRKWSRSRVIIIRSTTTTRKAIKLVVRQVKNYEGNLTLATISLSGDVPAYIESADFAVDYGNAWTFAGMVAKQWNRNVNGNKRK